MTTPLPPHADRRGRRRRSRWRSARARRSAPAFALQGEQRQRPRQRLSPAAPRQPRTRARCGANPAALSRFPTHAGGGRAPHHHAVDQVPQRRLAAGAQPAARRRRRRRRRLHLRAEPVPRRCRSTRSGRSASASTRRSASTTEYDDGWLGRYQALKSEIKTINVNPALSWKVDADNFAIGVGVNYQQHQGDASPATSTTRARSRRRAGRRAASRPGPPTLQRHRAADARPRLERDGQRRRQRVGLEHRRRCGTSTPQRASARTIAPTIKYNVDGNVNFDNPTLPTLPPALAPVAGRSLRSPPASTARRCTNGGVTSDIKLPADRQPVDLLPAQHRSGT